MVDDIAPQATWFDRSGRLRLEISGPDRARFLHNLTTNDVKKLVEGCGQESFVTSPQGKTLAYVTLLATDRAILLRSDAGQGDAFVLHLARYGVFDSVTLTDVSADTWEYHLIGADDGRIFADESPEMGRPPAPLSHRAVTIAATSVRIIREDLTGAAGWTMIGPQSARPAIDAWLGERGAVPGEAALFDSLRIEAGTPVSGRDVQPGNLPQEVGRDDRAINFVKGCYLGQETVARLDALGHVNRVLRGGWIEGTAAVPPDGTVLLDADGKTVGTITSAAFSPGRAASVFLGYVRVAQAAAATRLTIPSMTGSGDVPVVAVVSELPMPRSGLTGLE